MKTESYILERLRVDAAHSIAVAEGEAALQPPGLLGRLREILIANLLAPWLPPFCKCATGTIVESRNKPRKSTQDDILVIDSSLAPPVFTNMHGPEGVFLFNSVLLRIEVQSKFNRKGLSDFIGASTELARMPFHQQPECKTRFTKPCNILVAFQSDSPSEEWDYEFHQLCSVIKKKQCPAALSGFVSAVCVVNKGFWFLKDFGGAERSWCRLDSGVKEDFLVYLIAHVSNRVCRAHAERQGRDPSQGLEVGIGSSLPPATIFPLPVS